MAGWEVFVRMTNSERLKIQIAVILAALVCHFNLLLPFHSSLPGLFRAIQLNMRQAKRDTTAAKPRYSFTPLECLLPIVLPAYRACRDARRRVETGVSPTPKGGCGGASAAKPPVVSGYAGRHILTGFPLRSIYSSIPPTAKMTKQERRE